VTSTPPHCDARADEPDHEFIFGLDRVLDGIEDLILRMQPNSTARRASAGQDLFCFVIAVLLSLVGCTRSWENALTVRIW
jgi:hypothetical protein